MMSSSTTGNDKDFRDQLGKFRLDNIASSLPRTVPPSLADQQPLPDLVHGSLVVPDSAVPTTATGTGTTTTTDNNTTHHPANTTTLDLNPSSSHAISVPVSSVARSKRVSTACDFCRKRKKKCDFRYPNCSACTRAGVRCTIPPPGPQVASASVPRDQLENLQKRVQWLEEIVRRKTGVTAAELATGSSVVDDEGDPDWWYQVPAMVATGNTTRPVTAGPLEASPTGNSSSGGGAAAAAAGGGGAGAGAGAGGSATGSSSKGPPGSDAHLGTDLPNVGEIFRDQLEHRRPSVARPVSSSPRVLKLASLEEAEKVAGTYFDGIGYQYPFLHRLEFLSQLRRIYSGEVPSAEMHYCYHITMAIALLIKSADDTQTAEFYRASQETLPLALQNEDLPAVRALLSLALYTMFATTGPSVWHVLGTTMRLATSLGLHKARRSAALNVVEDEMSKRAFWSLYNLDRLIAVTLGRPLGLADDDITVELPREFNDDWTEAPGSSSTTIPLQVVKLRRIFSRIYRYCTFCRPPFVLVCLFACSDL